MKRLLFLFALVVSIGLLAGCGAKVADQKEAPKDEGKEVPLAYVGSDSCKDCHSKEYEGWSKTTHTKMIQDTKVDPTVIVGDFDAPGNPFEVAVNVKKEDIIYTIGGKWKQRYVVKEGEKLRILPAEWIVKDQKWQPYSAEEWQKNDWGELCIGCHSTGYDAQSKKWVDNGIGCEACHGQGSKHADKPTKENIINPVTLTAKQQVETCGQCHVRGPKPKDNPNGREDALGYIPGGEFANFMKPLEPTADELAKEKPAFYQDGASKKHHQQYNDYVQSKHYTAELSCTTCHDPHGGTETGQLKDTAEKLCLSCHNQGGKAETKLDEPIDLSKYMPKRAKSATSGDITTHTFKLNQPSS